MNFNKKSIDKETASGLLNRLLVLDKLDIIDNTRGGHEYGTCSFTLDEFDIKLLTEEGPARLFGIPVASDGGTSYKLYIDDINIRAGHRLCSKIYNRLRSIMDGPSLIAMKEQEDLIKKDANLNFKKYK